jgi:hypothetical protein
MTRVRQIANGQMLLLISFLLVSCGEVPIPADQARESKSEIAQPTVEIWQQLDGSVPIQGESLYFRLYDDGTVEFDYLIREYDNSRRHIYSAQRTPATKISDEEYRRLTAAVNEVRPLTL